MEHTHQRPVAELLERALEELIHGGDAVSVRQQPLLKARMPVVVAYKKGQQSGSAKR